MSEKQHYHILNGDSLREFFPKILSGSILVLRECLVDGPVQGSTVEELYALRAHFIVETYKGFTKALYKKQTVSEIEKIRKIPPHSEVTLWFEDDLFCQVNWWFAMHLLKAKSCELFLVRPPQHTPYGFGGLGQDELLNAFEQRTPLTEIPVLEQLWPAYQHNDLATLQALAQDLSPQYPFILPAVQAHIDRQPQGNFPGRPMATLQSIAKELGTDDFGRIFQEFCKREPIYGFGDLQVKHLYDALKDLD